MDTIIEGQYKTAFDCFKSVYTGNGVETVRAGGVHARNVEGAGGWEMGGYRFVIGAFLPFRFSFLTNSPTDVHLNEANSFTPAVESVIPTIRPVQQGVLAQQLRKDRDVPITKVDGTPRPRGDAVEPRVAKDSVQKYYHRSFLIHKHQPGIMNGFLVSEGHRAARQYYFAQVLINVRTAGLLGNFDELQRITTLKGRESLPQSIDMRQTSPASSNEPLDPRTRQPRFIPQLLQMQMLVSIVSTCQEITSFLPTVNRHARKTRVFDQLLVWSREDRFCPGVGGWVWFFLGDGDEEGADSREEL
ncbi:hypothetical protein EV421DRAFT_2025618 [Armillaria borealis]|uniref:Uncharacterized protein n=1 Tax=Armillaria borealis TaxID=47425 RepID=A0AA39IUB6_9AGAR|nr:hypothetical protein EV421DRAFT_2025618 [Armillaria borealis]